MTDLIRRIDEHMNSDDAERRWLDSDNLLEEASQEIERLRNLTTALIIKEVRRLLVEEPAYLNGEVSQGVKNQEEYIRDQARRKGYGYD